MDGICFLIQYFVIPFVFIIWVMVKILESAERKNNEKMYKEILEGRNVNYDSISIEEKGKNARKKQLYKSQKENCKQIAEVIRKDLAKFKKDITPRLYDFTISHINDLVNQANFKELYGLYDFLKRLNNNSAQDDLSRFTRFK